MQSGNLKTKANYILGTNSYEGMGSSHRECGSRPSGEPWKGNQFWQFQDIWEFDDLKYENITNVFRITNGYEGQGSTDPTSSRSYSAVRESLMKKDNRPLQEDTSIFQTKCNKKLLTNISIFIKVFFPCHPYNMEFRHQQPSHIYVTNIMQHLFKIILMSRVLIKSGSTKRNLLPVLFMARLNSQKSKF